MCNRQILCPNSKLHSKEAFEGDCLEEGHQLCPERHVGFGSKTVSQGARASTCSVRAGVTMMGRHR